MRADAEGAGGKCLTLFPRGNSFAVLEQIEQCPVIVLAGYDNHVFEVFGCCTDQGNPTDVNLLDDLLVRPALRDGGLERVQVDNHKVDVRELVFLHVRDIFRQVPSVQDASENLGVKRFDAAAEDGRVVGDGFDGYDFRTHGF